LAAVEEPRRSLLFEELLRVELYWRKQAGEAPTTEEYEQRFLEYSLLIRQLLTKLVPAVLGPQDGNAGCNRVDGQPLPADRAEETRFYYFGSTTVAKPEDSVANPAMVSRETTGLEPSPDRSGYWIGRYELLRVLGIGAFGIVYLAWDGELHRNVAIKVPKLDRIATEADVRSYVSEASKVAGLDHPNIVPLYDIGRAEDGRCYTVSKFIDGGNLSSWRGSRTLKGCNLLLLSSVDDVRGIPTAGKRLIVVAAVKNAVKNVLYLRIFDGDGQMVVDTDETKLTTQAGPIKDLRKQLESLWPPHHLTESEKTRVIAAVTSIVGRTPLEPRKVAFIIMQIALALDHLHNRSLIHRDIKPENILFDSMSQPYLADLGLALYSGSSQRTSQVAGSPAYMSPEQTMGDIRSLDGRSDVFSLGVVFYELLTGGRPFEGRDLNELCSAIRNDNPPSPDRIRPSVPASLARICMRCLEKSPGDRYNAASVLARSLSVWLSTEEPSSSNQSVIQDPWPPNVVAWGLATLLFAVVAWSREALVDFYTKGRKPTLPPIPDSPWLVSAGIGVTLLTVWLIQAAHTARRQHRPPNMIAWILAALLLAVSALCWWTLGKFSEP
jgi:serine/threonine protein kinase